MSHWSDYQKLVESSSSSSSSHDRKISKNEWRDCKDHNTDSNKGKKFQKKI